MQNNFEYKFVEIEITEKQFTDFTKVIEDLITRKSQYVREWNMNHFKKTYDFIQLLAFDEVNSIFHDIELTDKELKSLNKWRDLFRKKYENL